MTLVEAQSPVPGFQFAEIGRHAVSTPTKPINEVMQVMTIMPWTAIRCARTTAIRRRVTQIADLIAHSDVT
jgi:hypothetical protein